MSMSSNGAEKCRWCGRFHGPQCPSVKAIEFDPLTGVVTRVEFVTSADFAAMSQSPETYLNPYKPVPVLP